MTDKGLQGTRGCRNKKEQAGQSNPGQLSGMTTCTCAVLGGNCKTGWRWNETLPRWHCEVSARAEYLGPGVSALAVSTPGLWQSACTCMPVSCN